MKDDKTEKDKQLARRKKFAQIFYHEKLHKEQREKMHQADGGYTADISMDGELDTLKDSWQDKATDMRARLRKGKAKAKAMWRGR